MSRTSAALITVGLFASTSYATPATNLAEVQIALKISKAKISGGEKATGEIVVKRNGNIQELVFRLENSNPSVVRLAAPTITIRPDESSASFEIFTAATPITTAVTIKAVLDRLQAQAVLEIVPAMLKEVTLSQPTINGTLGSRIAVRVELNANAPAGGIELLRQLSVSLPRREFLTLINTPDFRIAAGSKAVTFEIHYSSISLGSVRIRRDREFNAETRTVELVISLEEQTKSPWKAVPDIAGKVQFGVIPLRVTSASVQPTPVTGGTEALATFTLNFPAGPSEELSIQSALQGSTPVAWPRLLGSSCAGGDQEGVGMSLVQGGATHSFKVCTASRTTIATGKLLVRMPHGADFPVPVALRP